MESNNLEKYDYEKLKELYQLEYQIDAMLRSPGKKISPKFRRTVEMQLQQLAGQIDAMERLLQSLREAPYSPKIPGAQGTSHAQEEILNEPMLHHA